MTENKPGRPSAFSPELASEICHRLSEGESLRSICKPDTMPAESTVRRWAVDDVNGFFAQYARARDTGLDAMADETLEISDNASNDWMERHGEEEAGWVVNGDHVARSRLRVDTRKWYLSKLAPKRYGDKVTQEHTGADGGPIKVIENIIVRPPDKNG